VAKRIGDLTVAFAPEGVVEGLPHLRAGVDCTLPDRIDVVRVYVQDRGGPADAGRREDAGIGELVRQHHCRVSEPQLDLHQLSSGNREPASLLRAEHLHVPLRGRGRIADHEVRRDRVHAHRRLDVRLVHTSTSS
jgi:hypothetical protein